MPNKMFLEKYPLYQKYKMDIPNILSKIPKAKIHMFCEVCNSEQTFAMNNNYWDNVPFSNNPSNNLCVLARYLCVGCDMFQRYFLIRISPDLDYIIKVGFRKV